MYRDPTAHDINPETGLLSQATGRYEKRLRDLEGVYLDTHALAPGIYLLTISDGVSEVSQKITIYH